MLRACALRYKPCSPSLGVVASQRLLSLGCLLKPPPSQSRATRRLAEAPEFPGGKRGPRVLHRMVVERGEAANVSCMGTSTTRVVAGP